MNDDPLIEIILEQQAEANAGTDSTGVARDGDICAHYYPVSGRFAWFNLSGRSPSSWRRSC